MPITDAQVIKYTNEVVRPLAEKFRNLKIEVDAALVTWFSQVSANTPNSAAQALEDGRDAEGVSRLNGADINNFITQLSTYQSALNQAGVADVIEKPTVRPVSL